MYERRFLLGGILLNYEFCTYVPKRAATTLGASFTKCLSLSRALL
jgi:hypothetical protein